MYDINKNKYYKKKNVYYRPWGRYVNLFEGKGFLIKELFVKPKGILSLQKHHHRSEHWLVTQGTPKITLNKESFFKKQNDYIFIPLGAIHRIENKSKKPVKIIEAQVGSILKETDIVRYQDIYGRRLNKMKKKINKNKGMLFWVTGLSGSGKTVIAEKIKSDIAKYYGPTLLVSGDDLRKIFKFNKYTAKERKVLGKYYCNFAKKNLLQIKKLT